MLGHSESLTPSHEAPNALAEARGLVVARGQSVVLRGVSLALGAGERVAVLGPNGAGKTTLIQTLAGLIRPRRGGVWILGRPFAAYPAAARRAVGVVGHQSYLYPDLTAEENLRLYARLYRVADPGARIDWLLAQVGLVDRRKDRMATFSRGMVQRLTLARALLHDPSILLLDEPDTGLDGRSFERLESLLAGEDSKRRTALFTTHQIERGLRVATRMVVLAGGRIVVDRATTGVALSDLRDEYDHLTGQSPALRVG